MELSSLARRSATAKHAPPAHATLPSLGTSTTIYRIDTRGSSHGGRTDDS